MTNDTRRQAAVDALRKHGGNITQAAAAIGLTRSSLRRLIKREKIEVGKQSASESFSIDQSKDAAHIESKSFKIKTVADAIAKADVDLSIWSIDRFNINSWEVGKSSQKILINYLKNQNLAILGITIL